MSVTCQIKNYKALRKRIEDMKKAPRKVINSTFKDIKSRGPGWIAAGVSEKYNVKARTVTSRKLGTVKFTGNKIDRLQLEYEGRLLTPTHFGMTPKAPKKGGYTVTAEVVKGKRKELGGSVKKLTKKQRRALAKNFTKSGTQNSPQSPVMLMHTGNTKEGGTNYIPFQRVSANPKDIVVIKRISLPQMVTEGKDGPLHPEVERSFNENLEKRFNHHMKRHMGK